VPREVRHRKPFVPLLVVAVLSSASCARSLAPDAGGDTSSAAPGFPTTIRQGGGVVTIPERPTRIVSLSPTATEMLFAIGAGDQVVAVDDQSNYPPQAPTTKLSGFEPNVEAIAAYEPDLVVASDGGGGLAAGMRRLGIPILVEPAAGSLADTYDQIGGLGRATGHTPQADALAARMKKEIATIVAATPRPAEPLGVYHELDDTFYSATSDTFIGRIYALFGLRNVADGAPARAGVYPQLSSEYLIRADPDLIVLADTKCCGQSPATVAARPGWGSIAAVRDGEVIPLDDDVASRWGPRVVEFVREVAQHVREVEGVAPTASASS
jgi:iron complex transport system substrate-binding protein